MRYKDMASSSEFADYVVLANALRGVSLTELASLPESIRFSFFVNLYNALIIHATCVIGAPDDSPEARSQFFNGSTGAKYRIGGVDFSPDDIEHGVLRASAPHPSSGRSSYFSEDDPRLGLCMSAIDPRLHFLLNCGARSCPPIQVLSGDPEQALRLAAASYLDQEVYLSEDKSKLVLPRLLLWYGEDFARTIPERVKLVLLLMSEDRRRDLMSELERRFPGGIQEADVEYSTYDWSANVAE